MPYKLRLSGSNDFVSNIDPEDKTCFPLGSVKLVSNGWNHPDALTFKGLAAAVAAAKQVEYIEGFHISIEEFTELI